MLAAWDAGDQHEFRRLTKELLLGPPLTRVELYAHVPEGELPSKVFST